MEKNKLNNKFDSEFVITIDIEWSSQDLIDNILDILNEYKIKSTLFATHKAELGNRHEIALHPYFKSPTTYENTLNKMIELFPKAKGIRSHRLLSEETLLLMYKQTKIQYTSNYQMTNLSNITPLKTIHGILEIPIFYIDWTHLMDTKIYKKISLDSLNLQSGGLKVFDFHPIHIFLNSESMQRYDKIKKWYNNPKELNNYVNKKKKGVGTLFVELLEFLKNNKIKTSTMLEISKKYKN